MVNRLEKWKRRDHFQFWEVWETQGGTLLKTLSYHHCQVVRHLAKEQVHELHPATNCAELSMDVQACMP